MGCPAGVGSILGNIKGFQLVFVDRRGSDDDDIGILSPGGRVLDEFLEVLFVSCERDVLYVGGYTGIVCSKEDGLDDLVSDCGNGSIHRC